VSYTRQHCLAQKLKCQPYVVGRHVNLSQIWQLIQPIGRDYERRAQAPGSGSQPFVPPKDVNGVGLPPQYGRLGRPASRTTITEPRVPNAEGEGGCQR
jgi:hypothetical protein